MFNDLMSAKVLTTFVGLVGVTSLIVQFTKWIIKKQLGDSYVRLYAFIVALILTFIFARNTGGLEGIILTVINSVLVTIAAMGGYEVIKDPTMMKIGNR
ncbi:MAG: hypothetical protein GX329_03395 [Tissierellia bacterium]|nr:hypothetical protein [Tissierellia bacterium]